MLTWDGKSGSKVWSELSAPTGQDWSILCQELIKTQVFCNTLEERIEDLEARVLSLESKDSKPAEVSKILDKGGVK